MGSLSDPGSSGVGGPTKRLDAGRVARTLLYVSCSLAVGCSCTPDDRPRTAEVRGTVSYRGQPVEGARVSFISERAPRFGMAMTDSEGRYQLTTFEEGDGAVLGEHVVTVSKPNYAPPIVEGPRDGAAYQQSLEAAQRAEQAGSALPERYADPKTTDLKVLVEDGDNEIDLKLVD